jgi:hypothetical protein
MRDIKLDLVLRDIVDTLASSATDYDVWRQYVTAHGLDPNSLELSASRAAEAARRIEKATLQRGRKGYGDEHYGEIAVLYLDVLQQDRNEHPDGVLRAVARRYAEARGEPPDTYPVATIRYWVTQARRRQFLTAAQPGKAGGQAGPRLTEDL